MLELKSSFKEKYTFLISTVCQKHWILQYVEQASSEVLDGIHTYTFGKFMSVFSPRPCRTPIYEGLGSGVGKFEK